MAGKGDQSSMNDKNDKVVFWGCFIALITTSFAFFSRMYLCNTRFADDFGLDSVAKGELIGAGIWPFGVSIIVFSLIIDKVGYRAAMMFSFVCYAVYLVFAFMAYDAILGVEPSNLAKAQAKGLNYLTWGSFILALGNGTVEAFINPVVATMFNKEKTKWLNILHAGWPGGLVLGGLITIGMADRAAEGDWRYVLAIIAVPAIVFFVLLVKARFPVQERESAGVSYREMLAEFGAFGAFVGFGLIFMRIARPDVLDLSSTTAWALTGISTAAFGIYTRSLGRPLMAVLIIIMMPLATTEIGTDGWITDLVQKPMSDANLNPGWMLVYTSAIMMVLRFFAGPIVHKFSPLGLLIISCVLAIAGLLALSNTGSGGLFAIFAAATLYGFGKTFFWPTMLGITSEQCPKGGALTLNAISGIGMIAVGVIGGPLIGAMQATGASNALADNSPKIADVVVEEKRYFGLPYRAINSEKGEQLQDEAATKALAEAELAGQLATPAKIAIFPAFMLVCYIAMFFYFKSKGGYKAVELAADEAIADGSIAGGEA